MLGRCRTLFPGRPRGRAGLSLAVALLLTLTFASSAIASPTVSIVSPANGSTVKGTVTVTVTADAGTGDEISAVILHDGANTVGSTSCERQQACTVTLNWRATGLSGLHSLTAEARTEKGASGTSAAISVNVESPLPSVTILSPVAGSTVAGTVTVTASAATDPSQEDYPTSIAFYDGVISLGSISCQGQRTCEGSIAWRATGLSGQHALTAKVTTHRELHVISAPTLVTLVSPAPTVIITKPHRGASVGREITVTVTGHTDPSQDEYPTEIAVYDGSSSIGSVNCEGQQTCGGSVHWDARSLKGRHVLTAVIHTSREREATSPPVVVGVASRRPINLRCGLASHVVKVGRTVHGKCAIKGAPTGTAAAVEVLNGGHWQVVLRGHVLAGGRFVFKIRGAKRGNFYLWVYVGATSRTSGRRVRVGDLRIV